MTTSRIDRRTRRSRFRTDLPARSQFLLFPELWDMEENEVGYAIWVDHDWNVFAVGAIIPDKEFDPVRGGWYPGWLCWTYERPPERWMRLMVHVLVFESDLVATVSARPGISDIDGGLEPLFIHIPEPGAESVLPDPPDVFDYRYYPLEVTLAILTDGPIGTLSRGFRWLSNIPAGVYHHDMTDYIVLLDPYYRWGMDRTVAILLAHMEGAGP